MPPASQRAILDHRLVIVTGKGGTGKTSVVASLATAGARAGRKVLAVETGRDEAVPRLLAPGAPPVGYPGRELAAGITVMRIDPYAALAEYLGLQIGAKSVVDLVLRNKAFRQLMDAAPGWRELITLGKIWHLEQMKDERGEDRFDLIIVDAPATGHGITFLDVPRVAVSAVNAGPLRRHSGWVEEMIRDRERTLLLPVALAEELPARETAELVERLRDEVKIQVDRVVVNAVADAPFPAGLDDLDERLAGLPADLSIAGLPRPPVLAACAKHLRGRFELNRHYVGEIQQHTGLPTIELPYIVKGVSGPEDVSTLAERLLASEASAA